jgi:hypothetical protein
MMKNQSLDTVLEWVDEEGRKFTETIRQEYTGNNCVFSGGVVSGHVVPEDTFYLKWEKDGVEDTMVLMRPDEVAAVNWICAGLLWTETMSKGE